MYLIIYPDAPPELNNENDPKEWIRKYAREYILDIDEHTRFLRINDTDNTCEHMDRQKLHAGDIVQIRVTFEPYRVQPPQKDEYIGGIRMFMHEVVLIRAYNEIFSLQVKSLFNNLIFLRPI
jgi:hypothetical protein